MDGTVHSRAKVGWMWCGCKMVMSRNSLNTIFLGYLALVSSQGRDIDGPRVEMSLNVWFCVLNP